MRDEQIYLAHKAANPAAYPPGEIFLDEYDPHRELLNKFPPTDVQLQVWEDLCHVPHTLSFTRPAKFMYRGVAQFGAWAYAHAQKKANEQLEDDDAQSIISSGSDEDNASISTADFKAAAQQAGKSNPKPKHPPTVDHSTGTTAPTHFNEVPHSTVGRAGDPIPPFQNHMIRQRVTRYGVIYPLAQPSEIPSLHMEPSSIGVIKAGPVRKWLAKQTEWNTKFKREKRNVQKQRTKEMAQGYDVIGDEETPPPTALAGRRRKDMPKVKERKGKSWGLAMWSGWGSKHDETTIEKEKDGGARRRSSTGNSKPDPGEVERRGAEMSSPGALDQSRSLKSDTTQPSQQQPAATDAAQDTEIAGAAVAGTAAAGAAAIASDHDDIRNAGSTEHTTTEPTSTEQTGIEHASTHQSNVSDALPAGEKVPGSDNTFLSPDSSRPHNGTVAYPFKLKHERGMGERNASTFTLQEGDDVQGMKRISVASENPAQQGVGSSSNGTTGRDSETDGVEKPTEKQGIIAATSAAVVAGATGLIASVMGTKEEQNVGKAAEEAAVPTGDGSGDVVENGKVKDVEGSRPPLQTFVTAQEF